MKNLIVWLNSIINKHKALKRWRRVVTVLAAIMTFVTTYALILPAITVEKNKAEDVGGMYLEQEADTNDMLEENALEPIGVSIAAKHENAVTFAYTDDSMTATAVFGTNDEIPAGAELVVTPIDPESVEYTSLSSRAAELLDKEFIYDVTTCSFYDFALVLNNVDVTPKTGLVDIQIIFHDNTVEHLDDTFFAGRFARSADDSSDVKDELVSVNPDESSVIELADGIITVLSLKGNDLSETDSLVGILAGNVDEEIKAAAAETDAEIPDSDDAQEESAQADSAGTDGEEAAPKVGTLKASGSDYTVTLTYDATSEIPEGASLTVSEIAQNTKEYKKYLEETKKAMGLTEEETLPQYAARFFDIKIMVGGDEFVPESGVTVEIAYTEPLAANPETEVNAVHFHNDTSEPEVIEANVTEISSDGTSNVEFTAEAFSVYGVVYTVDFHWEVDGKVYEFSIPGGGFVSLEKVVEVLGISNKAVQGDDETDSAEETQTLFGTSGTVLTLDDVEISDITRAFVADVESVVFSNPELVWIGKVEESASVGQLKEANRLEVQYSADLTKEQIEGINSSMVESGDWALISVRPFVSQETLTVTMKNGDQFALKVTDAQLKKTVISASGEAYEITVTYSDDAEIPDGAELVVREILPEDDEYDAYYQIAAAKTDGIDFADTQTESAESDGAGSTDFTAEDEDLNAAGGTEFTPGQEGLTKSYYTKEVKAEYNVNDGYGRFFDIEIRANGQKIEPKAEVFVVISLAEVPDEIQSELRVVHFGEDSTEMMTAEENQRIGEEKLFTDLSFVADEFSVYSVVQVGGDTNNLNSEKEYVLVRNGGALSPEPLSTNSNHLSGVSVSVNNGMISTSNDSDTLPVWHIAQRSNNGITYYVLYTMINGTPQYLNLVAANDGKASVSSTEQLLWISTDNNNTFRFGIYDNNNYYVLDLDYNNLQNGFHTYSSSGNNSYFTLYELGDEVRSEVTVHFVKRDGTPIEGITYTGSNSRIVKNPDTNGTTGTFTIPYSGITSNIDLSSTSQWNWGDKYTYSSTHIAGTLGDSSLTYDGVVIEPGLITDSSHSSLTYYTRTSGSATNTQTNAYTLGSVLQASIPGDPNTTYETVDYTSAGDQDIYVILDPKPTGGESGSGGSSIELPDIPDPDFEKKMEPNDDGTYTLSLNATGHEQSEVIPQKANVLLITDTSSSMHNDTGGKTRIQATRESVVELSNLLLNLNEISGRPDDTIEMAMLTFDGDVDQVKFGSEETLWTASTADFQDQVNVRLRGYNSQNALESKGDGTYYENKLHKGTDWEDALDMALNMAKAKQNSQSDEPIYVIFFTDGEPSQYRNFHRADPPNSVIGGLEHSYQYFNAYLNRETSKDEARAMVNEGMHLYGIYAFNGTNNSYGPRYDDNWSDVTINNENEGQLLHNLIKYAYDTTADLEDKYFYSAANASILTTAFSSIINDITKSIGYQDILMTDGITGMTSTALVQGTAGNFQYTVKKVETVETLPEGVQAGEPIVDSSTNTSVLYTLNEDNTTYTKTTTADAQKNNADGTVIITFPDGTTDTINQASYDAANKIVTWNFGEEYQLRDGYTYTVYFTVWPNQLSYDLIADLNNGLAEWREVGTGDDAHAEIWYKWSEDNNTLPDGADHDWINREENGITYKALGADYTKQIVKSGNLFSLRSNVESGNEVTYYKVYKQTLTEVPSRLTDEQKQRLNTTGELQITDESGKITIYKKESNGTYTELVKTPKKYQFVNPDPMPLTGTSLDLVKEWNDTLDPGHLIKLIEDAAEQGKTYSVTLNVLQEGETYKSYVFTPVKQYYTDSGYTTESPDNAVTEYYKYLWPAQTVYVSPALLVSELPAGITEEDTRYTVVDMNYNNKDTYYKLNDGYTYTITEDNTDYHFEFTADPYHPALVDNVMSNVEFSEDMTTAQVIGDVLDKFVAKNSLTSELDITKLIVDQTHTMTTAELDAETFTYKVTLTVPEDTDAQYLYAYEFVPRNVAWNGTNRIYAYGYQADEADKLKGLDDDVSRFNLKVFGRYTVSYPGNPSTLIDLFTDHDTVNKTKTGTLYITLKRNEILRFTNLPLGTQYEIEEVYANLRQADPSQDAKTRPEDNPEGPNLSSQGYTSISYKTKAGGVEGNNGGSVSGTTISGTVTALDTRFYNQYTNTRTSVTNDIRAELKVKKETAGYNFGDGGESYYRFTLRAGECTYSDDNSTGISQTPGGIVAAVLNTNNIATNGVTVEYDINNVPTKVMENSVVDVYNDSRTPDLTATFGNICYTMPGLYTYTITETWAPAFIVKAPPVTLTVVVKREDFTNKLYIEDIFDDLGTTYFTPATDTALATGLTTQTNATKPISVIKIDSETNAQMSGAEFEISKGFERLYIDSANQVLTTNQLIDRINAYRAEDEWIHSLEEQAAKAYITSNNIKTSFTTDSAKPNELKGLTISEDTNKTVYTLKEIKAPSGYIIVRSEFHFIVRPTVNDAGNITNVSMVLTNNSGEELTGSDIYTEATVDGNMMRITISNPPGAALPNTGGPGTNLIYLLGFLLTALAGAGLMMRKRKIAVR